MPEIFFNTFPISILYKSIAGRYHPVKVADGPITARCRFMKNASWVLCLLNNMELFSNVELMKVSSWIYAITNDKSHVIAKTNTYHSSLFCNPFVVSLNAQLAKGAPTEEKMQKRCGSSI